MDQIEITPMSVDLVESFHRALDAVARERKYLAIVEAFPLEAMRSFVATQIKTDAPAFAALERGEVIGWCDIERMTLPTFTHRATVGIRIGGAGERHEMMGQLPAVRPTRLDRKGGARC